MSQVDDVMARSLNEAAEQRKKDQARIAALESENGALEVELQKNDPAPTPSISDEDGANALRATYRETTKGGSDGWWMAAWLKAKELLRPASPAHRSDVPWPSEPPGNIVRALTAAMREADAEFETVGGSTRHHVRDCLIPAMGRHGLLIVVQADPATHPVTTVTRAALYPDAKTVEAWKAEEADWKAEEARLTAKVGALTMERDRWVEDYGRACDDADKLRTRIEELAPFAASCVAVPHAEFQRLRDCELMLRARMRDVPIVWMCPTLEDVTQEIIDARNSKEYLDVPSIDRDEAAVEARAVLKLFPERAQTGRADVPQVVEVTFGDLFAAEHGEVLRGSNRLDVVDFLNARLRERAAKNTPPPREAQSVDVEGLIGHLHTLKREWKEGIPTPNWTDTHDQAIRQWLAGQPRSMSVREPVRWFAERMEEQLRANDHKGGWRDDLQGDLHQRIEEEATELLAEIAKGEWNSDRIVKEAADVANFAMMIADNARDRSVPRPSAQEAHESKAESVSTEGRALSPTTITANRPDSPRSHLVSRVAPQRGQSEHDVGASPSEPRRDDVVTEERELHQAGVEPRPDSVSPRAHGEALLNCSWSEEQRKVIDEVFCIASNRLYLDPRDRHAYQDRLDAIEAAIAAWNKRAPVAPVIAEPRDSTWSENKAMREAPGLLIAAGTHLLVHKAYIDEWKAKDAENEAALARLRDVDAMYQRVVDVALRAGPIPASQRASEDLEPPWEVFARVVRERDAAKPHVAHERVIEEYERRIEHQLDKYVCLPALRSALARHTVDEPELERLRDAVKQNIKARWGAETERDTLRAEVELLRTNVKVWGDAWAESQVEIGKLRAEVERLTKDRDVFQDSLKLALERERKKMAESRAVPRAVTVTGEELHKVSWGLPQLVSWKNLTEAERQNWEGTASRLNALLAGEGAK